MNSSTDPFAADLDAAEEALKNPMGMFLEALKQMSADNRETTLAAIAEMKKPSPEEQAKRDEEKARSMAETMRRVEAAKQQDAERMARIDACNHLMPNGQTRLRGQVNSDGFARVTCSSCQYVSAPFKATDVERTQSGLNVDKWGPNAFQYVQQRIRATTETPAGAPRVPPGATIIFDTVAV